MSFTACGPRNAATEEDNYIKVDTAKYIGTWWRVDSVFDKSGQAVNRHYIAYILSGTQIVLNNDTADIEIGKGMATVRGEKYELLALKDNMVSIRTYWSADERYEDMTYYWGKFNHFDGELELDRIPEDEDLIGTKWKLDYFRRYSKASGKYFAQAILEASVETWEFKEDHVCVYTNSMTREKSEGKWDLTRGDISFHMSPLDGAYSERGGLSIRLFNDEMMCVRQRVNDNTSTEFFLERLK